MSNFRHFLADLPHYLLVIYLCACPFTKLFYHPASAYSVQVPELIFLLLLLTVLGSGTLRRRILDHTWTYLDYGVLILVLSQAMATFLAYGQLPQATLGLGYLSVLYGLGRVLFSDRNFWTNKRITTVILVFGGLLVMSVAISWLLQIFYPNNKLELVEGKYWSGLGWIKRVEAFTMSPNMLMSMLSLPLLLAVSRSNSWRNSGDALIIIALTSAAFTTFSKSVVPVAIGAVLILLHRVPMRLILQCALGAVALCLFIVFLVSTKVIWLRTGQADREITLRQSYATKQQLFSNDRGQLYKTMHYEMNAQAWSIFLQNSWVGVGAGQFVKQIEQRKLNGQYPPDKIAYGPHSLYLGTLAQTGLLGAAGLVFFLYSLVRHWLECWQQRPAADSFIILALGVFCLAWMLDGLNMDTVRFRHFWWSAGLLGAFLPTKGQRSNA